MLGILAPNKLFLNSISVFTVYTELETLPYFNTNQSDCIQRLHRMLRNGLIQTLSDDNNNHEKMCQFSIHFYRWLLGSHIHLLLNWHFHSCLAFT